MRSSNFKKIALLLAVLAFASLLPLSVFAQLGFKNSAPHAIWVAIAYYNGSQWVSEGWYKVEPGETSTVISSRLEYKNYYYYAEGKDKEHMTWQGEHSFLVHPNDRFTIGSADKISNSRGYSTYKFLKISLPTALKHTHELTANNRCTSGDCENGFGTYKWFSASRYYTGEWRNGYRHGFGEVTYGAYHALKGCSYSGNWAEGYYEGTGEFKYADGSRFLGEWVKDKKQGFGVLYAPDGSVQKKGQWVNDEFIESNPVATISWKKPTTDTNTTLATYSLEACINSTTPVTAWEIYVNGQVAASTRAPEVVPADGCSMMLRRIINLQPGENSVYISVTNKGGIARSATLRLRRDGGITPPPPAPVIGATKRLALLIGNADYQKCSSLRNPVNDARALAAILQELGFTVIRKENLDHNGMKRAIQEFGDQLQNYELGMVFYSGHGVQVKGRNYLIPIDASLAYESDTEYYCVDAGSILAKMEGAKSKVNVVVLDACRNNPFEKSWNRSLDQNGLASMSAPAGTMIAYATSPGTTASDGSGSNGLYTAELLRCLRIPNLKIEDVFKQVRIAVMQKSGNTQLPWESSSLTGDVILNKK